MPKENVSLELLVAKAKRQLGIRLEAIVEKWVERREFGTFYTSEQLDEMAKIVKQEMGVNVEFVINNNPSVNACVGVVRIPGHSGTGYFGPGTKPVTVVSPNLPKQLRTLKIDLDKGKITGEFLDDMKNRITIYAGLIQDKINCTAEEITSAIVHELGHVWNQYMALGDYVWLNYYLQDGIEVLMGKKPNIYKLEVLTEAGLEKYCSDKDALAAMKQQPTAKNIRRVILLASQKAPRHHLTSNKDDVNQLSLKREEQMADMFASRMGYARASVTLQVKLGQRYGTRYLMSSTAFVFAETCKVLLNIGALASMAAVVAVPPMILAAFALWVTAVNVGPGPSDPLVYDNDMERSTKFRRDLVAQLKVLGEDRMVNEQILSDIKMIDEMLALYRKHTTLWESLSILMRPETRRNRHQRAREEDLEILLNNDLFVAAAKFDNLSRKLS